MPTSNLFDAWAKARSEFEKSPNKVLNESISKSFLKVAGREVGVRAKRIDELYPSSAGADFDYAGFKGHISALFKATDEIKAKLERIQPKLPEADASTVVRFIESVDGIKKDCARLWAPLMAAQSQQKAMAAGKIDWKAELNDAAIAEMAKATAALGEYKSFEKEFKAFVTKYDLGSTAEQYPFRIWNSLIFSLCQAGKGGDGLPGWKPSNLTTTKEAPGRWLAAYIKTDAAKTVRLAICAQAILQLRPFIDHAERHLDQVIAKLAAGKEWAFWSGKHAEDAAKAETNGVVLEGTVGGWFDSVKKIERLTASNLTKRANGFIGEPTDSFVLWHAISELYARKAAENLEKFTFKGFLGPGSSRRQSVYNAIEKPTLIQVLNANCKAEPQITWYVVDCEEGAKEGEWKWTKKKSKPFKSRSDAVKHVIKRYGA
jgi:hypothetical protein